MSEKHQIYKTIDRMAGNNEKIHIVIVDPDFSIQTIPLAERLTNRKPALDRAPDIANIINIMGFAYSDQVTDILCDAVMLAMAEPKILNDIRGVLRLYSSLSKKYEIPSLQISHLIQKSIQRLWLSSNPEIQDIFYDGTDKKQYCPKNEAFIQAIIDIVTQRSKMIETDID